MIYAGTRKYVEEEEDAKCRGNYFIGSNNAEVSDGITVSLHQVSLEGQVTGTTPTFVQVCRLIADRGSEDLVSHRWSLVLA